MLEASVFNVKWKEEEGWVCWLGGRVHIGFSFSPLELQAGLPLQLQEYKIAEANGIGMELVLDLLLT